MNRINPLYIAVFLALILGIIVYQNRLFKEQISQKEQEILILEQKAKKIATLKRYWKDKNILKRRLEALLRSSFIAKYIKKRENKSNKITVYLENIDPFNANRITDKILNSFVRVSSISFKRKDNNHLNIKVEFTI